MWKLNPFMPREPTSLEGRTIDISNVKVCVQNIIAEGGFSRVYLVRDAAYASRQYAMKHIICNDRESLDLVLKEITVMKLLRGHPNVVKLVAHTILDMGRTKEALLVMEFCDKSLVTVLENRGSGYFEEKQVLLIFRDVCNAVFAMHCQSPPIAHRDLKAENILLGSDGAWKLCDFGSTSTNHQCFDKPEERGIEEDNIRKYTTPAYRAPEMWDLYRREVISEKVDIWALGCLLYRICYLKLAFDGESKLQILNGNYCIPELPKYSASTTGLIKDMLEASPNARPDITQVWFRVNEQLPLDLQKHLPDGPISAINKHLYTGKLHDEGVPKCTNLMPRRSPPQTPSSGERVQTVSFQSPNSTANAGGTGPSGAFWSTRYAQESQVIDKDPGSLKNKASPQRNDLRSDNGPSKDTGNGPQKVKSMQAETKATYQNEGFNTFIAEFDTSKLNMRTAGMNANDARPTKEEDEGEINRLKEQLKQSNLEKAEITAKYEKLSAICRSQRQEIQELKRVIATATQSSLGKESSKSQISPSNSHSVTPHWEKLEGGLLELEQGMFANSPASPSPEPKPWQAFPEETQTHPTPQSNQYGSTQLPNGQQSTTRPTTIPSNFWPSNPDSRILSTPAGSQISRTSVPGNGSQRFGSYEEKKIQNTQPMGWAGF